MDRPSYRDAMTHLKSVWYAFEIQILTQLLEFLPADGSSSSGNYATILVEKKRYDIQCYGDGMIHVFCRIGTPSGFDPEKNPAGTGIAPQGNQFYIYIS